ncbi:MAG: hypothetical protein U1E70_02730 [Acetobacteraceae bacterium]
MTGRRLTGLWPVVLPIAAVAFSVLPMLLVSHLPLVDYPNHLARFVIRQHLQAGSPLSRFYEWHWAFIPTAGLDLLVVPLSAVLPVESAGNLVMTATLVLLCLGTMAVDRGLNASQWGLSLFTGIILYSGAFRFGFASYFIGTSLALLLFALWLRRRPVWYWRDTLCFLLTGVGLLLVHLYAFGLYAVCVAGYETSLLLEAARANGRWRMPRLRPSLDIAATLVLPLTALAVSPTSSEAAVTRWSTLTWKLEALVSPVYFNQPLIELPLLLVLLATFGIGLGTGVLRLHRRMLPALLVFLLLTFAFPRTLFGSNYADYRLPAGAGFFFLASLRLDSTVPLRRRIVLAVLSLCLVVRIASIVVDWVAVQPVLAEYRDALAPVPPGARLLVIRGEVEPRSRRRTPPLEHVPVLAAARQQAFTGYIFAGAIAPLKIKPGLADYIHFAPNPDLAGDLGRYDYLLAVQDPVISIPQGITLTPLRQGASYVLSRIDHP